MKTLYDKNANFDAGLKFVIKSVRDSLEKNDDDFLLMAVGETGTGKSVLMLHAMEHYLAEDASVDYIGLNKESFATALKLCKEKERPRFCANDEANISKRDSLTKYNKAVIDLYLSIRGLNIFHWWNNPSLDMIDKHFIEEKIKGVIYIVTKDRDRPRVYYYFRKKDLLKLWDKYGNLKLQTLKKYRKEYAYYKGWFRDYTGFLKKDYLEKKNQRMSDKVDEFFDNYGEENTSLLTKSKIAKKMNITAQSIYNYTKALIKSGELVEGRDYVKENYGQIKYNECAITIFQEEAKRRRKKYLTTLGAPIEED